MYQSKQAATVNKNSIVCDKIPWKTDRGSFRGLLCPHNIVSEPIWQNHIMAGQGIAKCWSHYQLEEDQGHGRGKGKK